MRHTVRTQHGPDVAAEAQTRLIERLAVSEKRHREILDELPEVVILLDSNGCVDYVSSAWKRLMGMDPENIRGRKLCDLVIKEDQVKWNELLKNGENPEIEPLDRLVRFNRVKDDPICMNTKIRLLETGEYVCSLEDFTIRRRLEAELLKSQKLESIGRLAGGLAHDFNNSLAIILGNLNIAQAKLLTGKNVEEELGIAALACTHASGVTKQMLAFSKGGEPVTTVASMEALVRESADLELSSSNTRVLYNIDEMIPLVEIDRGQIQQVLINLMLNADQAMPNGGDLRIRITCGRIPEKNVESDDDNAVVVEIMDEGEGIPKDEIENVFDPYFTTKEGGTGLGLTSAFWIIQRHGGIIELESTPGVGTTIRIMIPFAKDNETDDALLQRGVPSKTTQRILIMDDNELVRGALNAMLDSLGHEVVATNDGDLCVETYRQAMNEEHRFDLVILDLTVPGGHGGVWSMEQIRKFDPHVCAIVASGYSSDSVLASPDEIGFKARLQKPFEINELQEAIDLAMLRAPVRSR